MALAQSRKTEDNKNKQAPVSGRKKRSIFAPSSATNVLYYLVLRTESVYDNKGLGPLPALSIMHKSSKLYKKSAKLNRKTKTLSTTQGIVWYLTLEKGSLRLLLYYAVCTRYVYIPVRGWYYSCTESTLLYLTTKICSI